MLLLLACGSDDGPARGEKAGDEGEGGTSGDRDADDRDADGGAAMRDGAPQAAENRDAARVDQGREPPADALAARDASEGDARAASDASAPGDGVAVSLRARICGDATSFPAPLPPSGPGRTAQRVGSERFEFIEGPVWVAELGVLLFSDINMSGGNANGPPARIRRLTPPMTFDVFAEMSNSNGLALYGGAVLAATHDTQSLSLFDLPSGARTNLNVRAEGRRLNSPNDLAARSDGTVYFTDPDWQLGARTSETGRTGVYRLRPPLGGSETLEAALIEGGLDKPNGIALSPDERTLYVGSAASEIWKYTVAEDGSVSGRTKFADTGPSDGLTVDCAGNLYVTSGTVEVFAPSGMKLGDIVTAEGPSNVAFGGPEAKTLYITARTGLYSIALQVPGWPY